MEAVLGFPKSANLHSFRNLAPTCANKLRSPREERERLGHRAPWGAMPDRYDKAVCAAELRLRNEILGQIRPVWRPKASFEVEKKRPGASLTLIAKRLNFNVYGRRP